MNERPGRVEIPWSRAEWRQCRRCGSPVTTFSDYGGSCWACLSTAERDACRRAERGELDAGEVRAWLLDRTADAPHAGGPAELITGDGSDAYPDEGCSV